MEKKYKLSEVTKTLKDGTVLHRIQALKDIVDEEGNVLVKKGQLGGYVERYNLSQEGTCWIYDDAMVYLLSTVEGDAIVKNKAKVYGACTIKDNAIVCGNALIHGWAKVIENAIVCENAEMFKGAVLRGDSILRGRSFLCSSPYVKTNNIEK